jgi:hypothetical protein
MPLFKSLNGERQIGRVQHGNQAGQRLFGVAWSGLNVFTDDPARLA